MKLYQNLTLGLVFAATTSIQAATLFSDTFDSYANGTADAAYTAAYNNNPGTGMSVTTGTGLSGTKSIQNNIDSTLTRKDLPINLVAGDIATVSIFFQQVASPSGAARPQIGFLGLSDNGGVFNGGTGGDLSARIGGGNTLEFRANNGATGGPTSPVLALTDGLWYNLQFQIIKSSTPNLFDMNAWLYDNTSTLVASISQTGFSNGTIYNDTSIFAGLRESVNIVNMDNFSANITAAPEPGTVALLSFSGAVVFFVRRRMTRA